jgi:hypothetical protein
MCTVWQFCVQWADFEKNCKINFIFMLVSHIWLINKSNITNKFVVQTSVTAHAFFFFSITSTTKPNTKLPYLSTYLPSSYYQTRITKFNQIHLLKLWDDMQNTLLMCNNFTQFVHTGIRKALKTQIFWQYVENKEELLLPSFYAHAWIV